MLSGHAGGVLGAGTSSHAVEGEPGGGGVGVRGSGTLDLPSSSSEPGPAGRRPSGGVGGGQAGSRGPPYTVSGLGVPGASDLLIRPTSPLPVPAPALLLASAACAAFRRWRVYLSGLLASLA